MKIFLMPSATESAPVANEDGECFDKNHMFDEKRASVFGTDLP